MTPRPRLNLSLNVTLYTRPGCHLCEDALAALERLRSRHPFNLQVVDITADPDLLQRYGARIPVVEVHGREFAAPLSAAVLERALRQAARTSGVNRGV